MLSQAVQAKYYDEWQRQVAKQVIFARPAHHYDHSSSKDGRCGSGAVSSAGESGAEWRGSFVDEPEQFQLHRALEDLHATYKVVVVLESWKRAVEVACVGNWNAFLELEESFA